MLKTPTGKRHTKYGTVRRELLKSISEEEKKQKRSKDRSVDGFHSRCCRE